MDAVRITVDTNHSVNGWEEIDAVQLQGTQSAAQIIVSPNVGPRHDGGRRNGHVHGRVEHATHSQCDDRAVVERRTEGIVLLPNPPSLTFTSANWNTPQTVTVTGVDDT